jgi:hypothetical protein
MPMTPLQLRMRRDAYDGLAKVAAHADDPNLSPDSAEGFRGAYHDVLAVLDEDVPAALLMLDVLMTWSA